MKNNKDFIVKRIQSFLYSFYAKNIENARINEVYDCLCRYMMEIIGKTWVKSKDIDNDKDYYILSFEYLPGKFINRNIHRLKIKNEIVEALNELGFDLDDMLACETEADLGVGDIGIGSSALINELANQRKRAVAYALRYENGNLKQKIIDGRQVEYSDFWLEQGSNWEHKKAFSYLLEIDGRKNKSIAYDMPILSDDAGFVNTLRLFKSEVVENVNIEDFSRGDLLKAYDDYININSINKFLYIDDSTYEGKIFRLKQEYFYSVSAVRDIFRRHNKRHGSVEGIEKNIKIFSHDIHPSLALIEFIRILTKDYGYELSKAIEMTRQIFDHVAFSITDDSVEDYDIDMIRRINPEMMDAIIEIQKNLQIASNDISLVKNGKVSFRNINKYLSGNYHYLSKIIADARENDINHSYFNYGTDRILYAETANINLTNVLNNYEIDSYSYDKLGKIGKLKNNKDFINDLDKVKYNNKRALAKIVKSRLADDINPYSIYDIQLSIMHESKRQILNCLAIAYKYYMLKYNTNLKLAPTTYIFSGKANEGYFMAKETIKFILALKHMIDKDKFIREKIKIVFIEDLNVDKIKKILPAVDIYSNLTLPTLDNQNFHILNSIFNMSNILSTKGGIIDNLNEKNSFYTFGADFKHIQKINEENSYNANEFYYDSEIVKFTIDNLLNESYDNFPYNFKTIYDQLLMYNDSFKIFYDLEDLIKARKKIEKDYLDVSKWVKMQIDNVLWANNFRLDEVINKGNEFS
ncbi:glycogen/starch/alpha-glucan phosphorylase [uncultured Anaerococcus sp.]|uniref:glycogen/starch/alpha-glucan phosphorylase n=1 Tax=uncultured Anaerococcus sp. TaxID=293428 RepID=UPI00288B581F|nr:glycogen/starch/alpha-glucan phosphorylase [uncultured Anaerococcus sp.]